ncbi:YadA-like family protein [Acinetobacter baumannii]|uniref:Autotransporter adhesin n=1 Tax=Acinetobacter baumannii TaxID=470 RepID=A0A646MC24_ACIBA|nr:YadA-like family protein [Acinetobacter baumannii]EHU2237022.1 YadA-like family protein [Acinetobacter baumannii]EHU2417675.1 YadA-like family protein [Acinetobacter baumannii]MDC4879991.1 YadA-like family protein [Acinetobacter baumannii]MDC5526084.1 YadA-like family protein [Acinetobacter baumannii]MDC5640969.1 YadA-like family protein [Acinetobacter baumannii]
MNKIYRLIWNDVLGIWVTASELSKARGKRSSGNNIKNKNIGNSSSKVKYNQYINIWVGGIFLSALISTGVFAAGSADIGTPIVTAAIGPSNNCVSQAATNLTSVVPWTCLGQTATGGFTLINGVQANAQNVGQANLDARASGQEAIAIGFIDTTASGTNSVAIGETANALGKNSVAIGKNIIADNSNINEDLSNNVAIGSNSIASTKGSQYTVGSGGAVAIGYGEHANGVGAVAIGSSNTAEGDGAVAVGRINNAIGDGTIALGDSSIANGDRAVAVGSVAHAIGTAAVAVGDSSTADGWSAISIGRVANADADFSIAMGDFAQALSYSALALGRNSYIDANSNESIAQGYGSSVTTARNAVAIGSDATVSNRNSGIAIGDNAQVIVGSHINDVNGLPGSIAIGLNARSVGGSEVIIGSYAAQNAQRYDDGAKNTYGSDSVMLGNQAGRNSQYLYATFIGDQAGQNSIGQHNSYVGQNAARYRTGSYNTALGSNALTGISNTTNSTGNSNTAIGTASGVSLEGDGNTLTGVYTGQRIIGNNNSAFGNNAGANIKGNENIAIGYLSGVSSQGNNNVLLGSNSNIGVNTNNVVSIGTNTRATKENSIALGANANTVTDATLESEANLNGLTYGNFAGQVTNTGMQLSVGSAGAERQIKNVGSGSISETSTDAINGSQLYATNNILGNVANSTIDILGGDASLNSNGTLSMSNIGGTGQNTIDSAIAASRTKVAAGTNVADVVKTTGSNGQDIYTVNAKGSTASAGSSAVTVTAGTADANNVTDYAVDLSQSTKDSLVKADTALQSVVTQIDGVDVKTVNKDDNKVNFVTGDNVELTANADGSITVGTAADVTFNTVNTTNLTATGETKLGDSFTVNNGGSYYTGPITEGNHITNKTYVDQATAASRTEVEQGKNITVTSSTGVDGQNIYTVATADEVDFNKVTVGDTTITTDGIVIANGPSITKDGISAGDKKVTDVADGLISADSKDAINGSQLFGLGNNLTQLFGGNALYTNNQITWSNIGGTGQNTIDDAIKHVNDQAANANQGWNVSTDSGSNATSTVKPGQTVNINGDSDNGVLVTNSGNDIKVGLADQIKIGAGDNAVSIDGNSGTIQAGDVLIDGSKGNISAGKVTVNGEAGTVNGLTNTTWNPNNIFSGQAATEDQLQQVAQNATAAATAAKTTVSAGENITVSSSKNADGSTNYQVATSKDVKFDTVTSGSITTDKVSVGNITIDQTGINAGASKVTNVADGTINSTSKDAINGSQLHASNTNIYNYLGGGANYETNTGPTYNVGGGSYNNVGDALNSLDQQVTNVSNQLEQAFYTTNKRIDDLEDHANGGIAQAMATAGLPQAYIPGKSMMAISGGTYRGESGYAIGMSSISDNGKWVFKMSGSGNSRGDFGGTVGAGIQW